MKTLFKSVFSLLAVATICLSALSSCKGEDEVYDFVFDIPGSIVTEPGATIEMPFTACNITSISTSSKPEGWTVKSIDMQEWIITIVAPEKYASEDNSIEENGTLTLVGYTAAGTTVKASAYLSLLREDIDLTEAPSNSYAISQKDTRYTIDVTRCGEMGNAINPARVDLLWQSEKDFVQYFGYTPNEGTFTFFVGHEEITNDEGDVIDTRIPAGNAVVAAYDNNDKIIWSWHIWATDGDINDNAITASNGVVFMDRNLGAYSNPNGSTDADEIFNGYGMYYQWGRKDPFYRPYDYAFKGNTDKTVYSATNTTVRFKYADAEKYDEAGSMEFAIQNPTIFVRGSKDNDYDWLYNEHCNDLWGDKATKSQYDPCPKGWRLPSEDSFDVFDIAEDEDAAASADVRARYGWTLVDKESGVKMFMPAAGRKSFETGVFTNMSDYGTDSSPLPWIGYYWTNSADKAEGVAAYSLYFDLNNTRAVNNHYQPNKVMYRANAMQVRCVRE
ncbi:MAG: hypothetical protein IIV58_06800 [Alistipes sp.]|nr:hypothetical protein [Alistipes sp.]